jgi:hypothetical protein
MQQLNFSESFSSEVLLFHGLGTDQGDNRGLQCFKLNGNQTENDRYWQFFSHLHFKIEKNAIMTQKIIFWKISFFLGIKKRRIYVDFKFVVADLNKCPQKS